MEFENLYIKTYNEAHISTENFIKKRIIELQNSGFSFTKISNEILSDSYKNSETNKFNCIQPYIDLIYTFENHKKDYSKNQYEYTFKNNVKPLFDNLKIKDYSFEELISELATYYSDSNIYRIFNNQYMLYNMIYESGDYSKFEIKEYDSILENTKIYIYYRGLIYPESRQMKDILKNNLIDNSKNKHKNDFEIDEQALILNLCLVDRNSIPITEKIKLLIIIGEIKDDSIFNGSSSDNRFYQKVNKGSYRKGSTNNMVEIINSILKKIENQDLNITNQTLKKHRTTLISEQNNKKK